MVHVKITRHPLSDEVIGYRFEAAIPNMEGRVMRARKAGGETVSFYATSEAAPSFRSPYFIDQSSDETAITPKVIQRFIDRLTWKGYRSFEAVGKYAGNPLSDIFPKVA